MRNSSTFVRPTAPLQQGFIKLSAIDQIPPPAYTTEALFFPLPAERSAEDVFSKLQSALAQVITEMPIWAGQVVADDNDRGGVQALLPIDPGVEFVVKDFTDESNNGEGDLSQDYESLKAANFPYTKLSSDLLAPINLMTGLPPAPCFRAQANFIKGGLILVFCAHHFITDGTGLTAVLESWSRHTAAAEAGDVSVTRQLPQDMFERSCLTQGALSNHAQTDSGGAELDLRPLELPDFKAELTDTYTWYISPEKIVALKEAASSSLAEKEWISTQDAVIALLWQRINFARNHLQKEGEKSRLWTPVNIRPRVARPMHPGFIGNAILPATAESDFATANQAGWSGLSQMALAIRQATTRIDANFIDDAVRMLESRPKRESLIPFHELEKNNLFVISWGGFERHGMYWGKQLQQTECCRPNVVRTMRENGTCCILPKLKDGGWEIITHLSEQASKHLKADKEFARFVEVHSF